ncbi:MAG TPA: type I 3-dehydroquinate dehydratase [Bacteroidota bacterium]|nr:type I 3-dehydroquinate dehydratase [Bacteroidota bacterium]
MIIVSVTGPRMSDALDQVRASEPWADMFEFRLDLIRGPRLAALLLSTRRPVIVTCRPAWEGGAFTGTERERLALLAGASLLGADYIDIELRAGRGAMESFLGRRRESGVIVSYHAREGERPSPGALYRRMRGTGADVLKFAFHARDAWENRIAFDFLRAGARDRARAVAIAMGEAGEPSRILYRVFGGWGTYAAAETGEGAAPGQIRARELAELYRAGRLNASTAIFGVIGNPVRQSKGIRVHNPLFAHAGRNAVYCRFAVTDLRRFFSHMAPLLKGFSVTHPHKVAVSRFLDGTDRVARAIGAVNTVVRRGTRLAGTNTDAPAALDAIERVTSVRGKTMLIAGTGGAARAIAFEAARRGAGVLVTGRNAARGRAFAREFRARFVPGEEWKKISPDILVNATPVGMAPRTHASPFPRGMLKGKVVFDAVYNPPVTRLLAEAAAAGARIVRGTEMYVNQAARQFTLYARTRPDVRLMKRLLDESLEDS